MLLLEVISFTVTSISVAVIPLIEILFTITFGAFTIPLAVARLILGASVVSIPSLLARSLDCCLLMR